MRIASVPLVLSLALCGCAASPPPASGLNDPPAGVERGVGPGKHLARLGATCWNGLSALTEAAVLVPASPYLLFWDVTVGVVVAGSRGAGAVDEGAAAAGWENNREVWEEAGQGDLLPWAPLCFLRPLVLCVLEPLTSLAVILGGIPGP